MAQNTRVWATCTGTTVRVLAPKKAEGASAWGGGGWVGEKARGWWARGGRGAAGTAGTVAQLQASPCPSLTHALPRLSPQQQALRVPGHCRGVCRGWWWWGGGLGEDRRGRGGNQSRQLRQLQQRPSFSPPQPTRGREAEAGQDEPERGQAVAHARGGGVGQPARGGREGRRVGGRHDWEGGAGAPVRPRPRQPCAQPSPAAAARPPPSLSLQVHQADEQTEEDVLHGL